VATVAHLVATTSSSNTTSYASGAFTPTAGDLLVAFVTSSGTVGFPVLDDSQGLGFTLIQRTTQAAGNTMYLFVANTLAAASSMTVTFVNADDAATGAVIFVAGVAGMTRLGIDAVVQTAVAASQAAGGTPAATFGASATTSNPTLVFCANAAASALLNPPTDWAELADTGYATPAQWGEYANRDSGFTGTTITWANTSATAFGVLIVELDASTATRTPPWVEVVGTVATAASGNVTPALPAGPAAGDLLVLVVSGADNVTVSNANYTSKLATNQGTALRQTILYRWWQSGDAAPVVTHTAGNAIIARILLVRGAVGTGDPFEVATAASGAASATITSADVTPTSAATCVLFACSSNNVGDTSGTPVMGAYSGRDPTFSEVADNANGTGSNEVVQAVAWGGAKATAALGARTATITGESGTPDNWIGTMLVITGIALSEPPPSGRHSLALLGVA
jgi:hypothetical protein